MTPACPPRRGTQAGARVAGSKPEDATSIQPYVRTYVRACVRAARASGQARSGPGGAVGGTASGSGNCFFLFFFNSPPKSVERQPTHCNLSRDVFAWASAQQRKRSMPCPLSASLTTTVRRAGGLRSCGARAASIPTWPGSRLVCPRVAALRWPPLRRRAFRRPAWRVGCRRCARVRCAALAAACADGRRRSAGQLQQPRERRRQRR